MVRGTLRRRMALSFITLFILAISGLYWYLSHTLERQTIQAIRNDMYNLQMHSYSLIKQYSLLNNVDDEPANNDMQTILNGIARSSGYRAVYINKEGNFQNQAFPIGGGRMYQSSNPIMQKMLEQHSEATINNTSVVTILKEDGRQLSLLSFPLYWQESYDGMITITADYSERYQANSVILGRAALFGALLLAAVVGLTLWLSRRLTASLALLSRSMLAFGEGKSNHESKAQMRLVQSRDEVGELAQSFQKMKEQIQKQMEDLEAERGRVAALEESKRRFYQQVTHELKTPLAAISGYAQIIGKPGFSDAIFLHKAAGKIIDESGRLHEMVVRLLEIASSDDTAYSRQLEPLDLKQELERCSQDMELKAAKYGITLELDLDTATVIGERDELRRVWINLIDNSIKYGSEGIHVGIHLTVAEKKALVLFTNETERDADANMVFEPFYRGAERTTGDGSGLGLAICKTIVERHGGAISFSRSGSHVCVEVTLPVCS
ncbi:sensor histidine kinase [Paenibacillus sp. CAU 1782]